MRTLKEARTQKNISLQQLSDHCAIDRRRLSAFEHHVRFPTADEQMRIEKAFGEKLYWSEKRVEDRAPQSIRKLFFRRFSPGWKPAAPSSVRLAAARSDHRELYDALYQSIPQSSRWFPHFCPMDSQLEAFTYLGLLSNGWSPYIDSPQAFCFRRMPIVDPKSREHCPNRRVPLVFWQQDDVRIVLFPQVHLRPVKRIWRVDALGCISVGKQREWFVKETDGKLHDHSEDNEREREICLPFLRFKTEDVLSPQFPAQLVDRAKQLLLIETKLAA